MIAPGIILPFDGNHADIPAGFVRETSLDGKYPKSSGNANPGSTGGSATHTHTSPAHSHTLASHTHSGTLGSSVTGGTGDADTGGPITRRSHAHSFTSSPNSTATSNAVAVTYSAVSNDPPFYTVIFIRSTAYNLIPTNALILREATSRSGMAFHTPSAGKFLKGAETGANAGATGGSTTNVHSINHGHSPLSHNHPVFNSQGANNSDLKEKSGDFGYVVSTHYHQITFSSSTQSFNNFTGNLTTSETVQPSYRSLNVYKNQQGSSIIPAVGDIAMWSGSLASIPIGWALCNGENGTPNMESRYLKANSTPTSSSTGGSNTHSHAAISHSHSASGSHTHVLSHGNAIQPGNTRYDDGSAETSIRTDHTHANNTVNASAPGLSPSSTTANPSSNEPEYRTVAYIQLKFLPITSGPLLGVI